MKSKISQFYFDISHQQEKVLFLTSLQDFFKDPVPDKVSPTFEWKFEISISPEYSLSISAHEIFWISILSISLYTAQHNGFNGTLRECTLFSRFVIAMDNKLIKRQGKTTINMMKSIQKSAERWRGPKESSY